VSTAGRRLTVSQSCRIAARRETVWRHLTEPKLVSAWFGDCSALAPDGPFRIDFGDGDFFVGHVAAWQAPRLLELVWKFMGLGAEYRVAFTLDDVSGSTDVAVRDEGALTQSEATGLDEGWRDFLARLETCCVTGQRARYQWTPSIGLAAVLGMPPAAAGATLFDLGWWQASFPRATLRFGTQSDHELHVAFAEKVWKGARTAAALRLTPLGPGTVVGVLHEGFDTLPADVRFDERRRFACLWESALRAEERSAPAAR
jgi:uncharacterized protein YndB with AHSA1/START domain